MLVRKSNVSLKLVDDIVQAYFGCITENNMVMSCSEISELLRHSMCKLLGLQSKGYDKKIEEYSKIVVNNLNGVVDVSGKSDSYKKGLLEACVHAMEMSRKKVLS